MQGFVLAFPFLHAQKDLELMSLSRFLETAHQKFAWFTAYRKERATEQEKAPHCVAFSFEQAGFNGLVLGISKQDNSFALDPRFLDAVRRPPSHESEVRPRSTNP
jgi:hypothetical protein